MRDETCCFMDYSFQLAPFHIQDSTYHSLCYTSYGALAGMINSSIGPPWMDNQCYDPSHHEQMLYHISLHLRYLNVKTFVSYVCIYQNICLFVTVYCCLCSLWPSLPAVHGGRMRDLWQPNVPPSWGVCGRVWSRIHRWPWQQAVSRSVWQFIVLVFKNNFGHVLKTLPKGEFSCCNMLYRHIACDLSRSV